MADDPVGRVVYRFERCEIESAALLIFLHVRKKSRCKPQSYIKVTIRPLRFDNHIGVQKRRNKVMFKKASTNLLSSSKAILTDLEAKYPIKSETPLGSFKQMQRKKSTFPHDSLNGRS